MRNKMKPIWVSEDIHSTIKTEAARQKKKINEFMKELSDGVKISDEPVIQKNKKSTWRYL
jgi:hypothetical protein